MTAERERIKTKIRGLLAKTEGNGCSEAEAMSAMDKVGQLLDQFNLTMDEISLREEPCETMIIWTGRRAANAMNKLPVPLAEYVNAKCWRNTKRNPETGKVELAYFFFGMPQDLQVAEYIYHLVEGAMERETEKFKSSYMYQESAVKYGGRRRASTSFQYGFINRIGAKLNEMREENEAREEARLAELAKTQQTGTDLIVLKGELVQREFDNLKMKLTKNYTRQRVSTDAYMRGSEAGSKVNLRGGIAGSAGQRMIGHG